MCLLYFSLSLTHSADERNRNKDHRHRAAAEAKRVVDEEHEHRHDDVKPDHAEQVAHHDVAELGQLEKFFERGEKALVVLGRVGHALFDVVAAEKHDRDRNRRKYARGEKIGALAVAEYAVKHALDAVRKQREHRRADDEPDVGERNTDAVERSPLVIVVRHVGGNGVVRDVDDRPCGVEQHVGKGVVQHFFPLLIGAARHQPKQQKTQPVRQRAEQHIYPALAPLALSLVGDAPHQVVGDCVPRLGDEEHRRRQPGRKPADIDEKVKQIEGDRREQNVGGQIPETITDLFFNGQFHILPRGRAALLSCIRIDYTTCKPSRAMPSRKFRNFRRVGDFPLFSARFVLS